jgi:hypothetical protein
MILRSIITCPNCGTHASFHSPAKSSKISNLCRKPHEVLFLPAPHRLMEREPAASQARASP